MIDREVAKGLLICFAVMLATCLFFCVIYGVSQELGPIETLLILGPDEDE